MIVHGGEKKTRSSVSRIVGKRWNPRSVRTGGLGDHSGITRAGSMALRVQYSRDISSDNGDATMLRTFLAVKRVGEPVRSDRKPKVNERVEKARPMFVRYWRCQP